LDWVCFFLLTGKIVFAGISAALGSLLFWFRHLKDDPNVLFCKALSSHIYLNLLIGMVKLAKNITPPKPNQMSFPMIIKNKPPAPQPIQNWNFEQGPAHWNEYSSNGYSIIGTDLPGNLKPTSGKYVAWLGGADNEISQISQTFFIPPDYQDLAFNYFFASKDECGNDYFFVKFNGAEVGYANLCTSNNSSQWATARYSMKAYQGQTVQLTFEVTTNDSNNSNALIDDVRMLLVGTQMSNEEDFLYEPIAPGDLFEIKSRPN